MTEVLVGELYAMIEYQNSEFSEHGLSLDLSIFCVIMTIKKTYMTLWNI